MSQELSYEIIERRVRDWSSSFVRVLSVYLARRIGRDTLTGTLGMRGDLTMRVIRKNPTRRTRLMDRLRRIA